MTKVDVQFTVIGPFSIHHAAKLISVILGRSNPNTGGPKHDFVCMMYRVFQAGLKRLAIHQEGHTYLFVIQPSTLVL